MGPSLPHANPPLITDNNIIENDIEMKSEISLKSKRPKFLRNFSNLTK